MDDVRRLGNALGNGSIRWRAGANLTTETDENRLYRPRVFNSTTKQRFCRDRRRRLLAHLGGRASDVQLVLIDRIVAVEWSVCRLHSRLDDGELSQHGARELLAFHNHLRLLTRELGLKPARPAVPTLDDHLAALARAQRGTEAA